MDAQMSEDEHDLTVLRRVLQGLIFSYIIGWGILVANVGNVPLLDGVYWQIGAVAALVTTVWLAFTLSARALVWWSSIVLSVVTIRSFAYANDGILNPFGVWLLVLSGVSITGISVIVVNALTGRLEDMHQ